MFEDLNKLPNGVSDFAKLRKEQRIYVDKTDLISFFNDCINSDDPFYCLVRPRRFGKTLNMSMLYYFFSNKE